MTQPAYQPGDTITLTLPTSGFVPTHDEAPIIRDIEPLTTTVLDASACGHVETVCPACIESWSWDWNIVPA